MDPRADLLPTAPIGDDDPDGTRDYATYGRFVSLGVIGRGGMGVVLRARDPELDRHVAIKVLGPSWSADSTSGQRLQREAQAMAKLSHPNVVTVYEMGQVGAERFIAMELVEGTTLRRWLTEKPRTAREIIAAFVECGRGLAAAHAADLVHRDFKPENVLIGADGRPRVTDFGLVAGGVTGRELGEAAATTTAPPTSELTVRGSVMGTPAYMAPEQWLGTGVDARTDQFAFCVALWEALYGERPFAGKTDSEIRAKVVAGEVRDPPRDRKAGRELEPILRRGISLDREARWPAMTDLLEQLRPRRPRWPWAVGALALAGAAIATYLITGRPAADPCPDPSGKLVGIWDAPARARIAAAFTTANPVVAADVSTRVAASLDRYTTRWRDASRAACRATRVEGTQSAELLDRRMLCLERRRSELATVTAALAKVDRVGVATSLDTVGGLGDLDQCANQDMLLASAPPTDPAQRQKVDALAAEIAASYASRFTAKPADRQARAAAAVETARALGYLPMRVRALEELHDAAEDTGDEKVRESALRELAQGAAEAHDDTLAARAWINLIKLMARKRRVEEAKALEPVAEAAVTRAGSPVGLRYSLFGAIGTSRMYTQDYDGSIAAFRSAIESATTDVQRASAQLAVAQVLNMKDGPKAAMHDVELGLQATEAAYGPNHPETADGLILLGQFLVDAGDFAAAEPLLLRALKIRETALGEGHRDVATTLHLLGNLEHQRANDKVARSYYERAVANFDTRGEFNDAGLARGMLAAIINDSEGLAAARPVFVAALEGLATDGKDQVNYISTEVNYADRLVDAHLCSEAAPLIAHATEVLTRVNPRKLTFVLRVAARCDVEAKHFPDAIKKLEQANALCAEHGCPPYMVSELKWSLGRTMLEAHRPAGTKLVEEAIVIANEQKDDELLAEIAAWRKKHP